MEDELKDILAEELDLIQLICIIISTSAAIERSFSTLKRIKSTMRSSLREDRLCALSLISKLKNTEFWDN